jgi:hypothetical protein
MIVNTATGEILDLSALRHKARGRKTKRLNAPVSYQNQDTAIVLVLVALVASAVAMMH